MTRAGAVTVCCSVVAVAVLLAARPVAAQPAGATYDEAKVPAYVLPDPLRFADGRPVTAAGEWPARRAEVLALFERDVYGRSPAPPAGMRFVVVESAAQALGGLATRRQVRVLLDGTESGPCLRDPPLRAERRAAARPGLPRPELRRQPRGPPRPRRSGSPPPGWARARASWPTARPTPRGERTPPRGRSSGSSTAATRSPRCTTATSSPTTPDGWKDGVRARIGPGPTGRFAPDDWGAIGAWAWGLSRALDCLRGRSRRGRPPRRRDRPLAAREDGAVGGGLGRAVRARRLERLGRGRGRAGAAEVRREDGEHHGRLPALVLLPLPRVRGPGGGSPRGPARAAGAGGPSAPLRRERDRGPLGRPPRGVPGREGGGARVSAPRPPRASASTRSPAPDRPVGRTIGYHLRRGKHALTAYDWEQYLDFADRHLVGARPSRRE